MKAIITKKGLERFCGYDLDLINDDYVEILDVVCDYITEAIGDEVSEENTYWRKWGDNKVIAEYELEDDR